MFTISAQILELQEKYAQDVLEYLQILDPGNTWRKNQIISRLRSITTSLAKVNVCISFNLCLLTNVHQFCNPFQKRTEKGSMDAVKLREMLYKIQDLTKALEKLNVQAEDKD